tara:strand:+ start:114 stop:353 length:240 start_codon:yes stop_codon:yes gene_type:complete
MPKLVEAICPRCDGNGYIKVEKKEVNCPMCEEPFSYMGKEISTNNGYVMLPEEQTRINVEGGRESKMKWSGETLPEVQK